MRRKNILVSTLVAASAMSFYCVPALAENKDLTGDITTNTDYSSDRVKQGGDTSYNVSGSGTVFTVDAYSAITSRSNVTLSIENGATMTVKGSELSVDGNTASFFLSDGGGTGAVNVSGTLNLNSGISNRDGIGQLNVKPVGVVNFINGISTITNNAGWGSVTLTVETGGRVNIKANTDGWGIKAADKSNEYISIKGGTIGFLGTSDGTGESWSAKRLISADGNGVTFDTDKYVMAADGNSSSKVEGAGGTIKLEAGLTSAGTVNVSGAGTLELGGTVSLSSAISNAGTVSLASGVKFELGNLTAGENNVYTLISNQDSGTLTGKAWNSLTKNDFTYQGYALSDRSTFDVSTTSGAVTFTDIRANLTWNGGNSGTWNSSEEASSWTTTDTDIDDTKFHSGDNVTFATSGAQITLAESVSAGTMTVSENTTITTAQGKTLHANSLIVDTGKTLNLASGGANASWGAMTLNGTLDLGSAEGNIDLKNVSGTGTVKYTNTATNHDKGFKIDSGFTGTLEYSGLLGWNNLNVGSNVELVLSKRDKGGNQYEGSFWGGSNKEISNKIKFNDYEVRLESADLTLTGEVSGTALKVWRNNGTAHTLTFKNKVELSVGLTVDSGVIVAFAENGYFVGDLTVKNGTAKLGGAVDGDNGKGVIRGGTITIDGNSARVELNVGDATGWGNTSENKYGVSAIAIKNGGTLHIGTTANQTGGNCVITMTGGKITGTMDNDGRRSNWDFFNAGSKLVVEAAEGASATNPTVSTIDDIMLTPRNVEGNSNSTTTVEVKENAKLVVGSGSGFWKGPEFGSSYSGQLEKTGAGTLEVQGVFAIDGNFTINGGTVILSGTNTISQNQGGYQQGTSTFSEATTVSAGVLVANNTTVLSQSAVSVSDGAKLTVNVTGVSASSVSLASGAKLVLSDNLLADVPATADADGASAVETRTLQILVSNSISLAETQILSSNVADIESYVEYGDAFSQYANKTWSYADNNTLTLTLSVPEPSAFGLLAGLGALALVASRRRRSRK